MPGRPHGMPGAGGGGGGRGYLEPAADILVRLGVELARRNSLQLEVAVEFLQGTSDNNMCGGTPCTASVRRH